MSQGMLMVFVLVCVCVCSAMGVIYSKHLSHESYADISRSQRVIGELNMQWRQLQIEQSTFAEYSLIERTARQKLDMFLPKAEHSAVIIVRQP